MERELCAFPLPSLAVVVSIDDHEIDRRPPIKGSESSERETAFFTSLSPYSEEKTSEMTASNYWLIGGNHSLLYSISLECGIHSALLTLSTFQVLCKYD